MTLLSKASGFDFVVLGLFVAFVQTMLYFGVVRQSLSRAGRQAAAAQDKLERMQWARHKGLRYDEKHDPEQWNIAYRFHGATPGGIPWVLYFDGDFTSSVSTPRLVWKARPAPPEAMPRMILCPAGKHEVGHEYKAPVLGQMVAAAMLGPLHAPAASYFEQLQRYVRDAHDYDGGDMAFAENFQLLVPSEAFGRAVFPREIIGKLMKWPWSAAKIVPKYAVSFDVHDGELWFSVKYGGFDVAMCEHIIAIGSAITDNTAKALSDHSRSPAA